MKYPFTYIVQGYNYEEEQYYLENGISICESLTNAADILEKHFGNELIAIKHLELYEDSTVITLPKGTFDEVVNCLESDDCFEIKCDEKGNRVI